MSMRIALVATLLLVAQTCLAQSAGQGTIYGTITDPSRAVIAGAELTVVNDATGLVRIASTNSQGDYRIAFLPPGEYHIEIRKPGFEKAKLTGTRLLVGQTLRADATLKIGVATTELTVSSEAAPVNTSDASQGAVIQNNEIANLPLNCLLYTSPSPRDLSTSRMPSSA